ncbi:pilus assembly PilX family protein [Lysobacter capsici]|uniref:pilus assembly PilX family protein n=1 Tax=Lysobacter capsici TaxID=435897 RepID=UPI000BBB0CDC|nr:PilX N-terminal domain-containing pilus assembly protein [Lysobacter capsici]ATE71155.1 PilX protein [Lysobacter capsici]
MKRTTRRSSFRGPAAQRGAALAVIMIMLLVMLLLGVSILRSTMLEERMSAGMYDRSLAFESAERALREGESAVDAAVKQSRTIGRDCTVSGNVCPPVPTDTYGGAATACAGVEAACWTSASAGDTGAPVAGTPQYYVEFVGRRTTSDDLGVGGGNPYEPENGPVKTAYYRVTARSHDPSRSPDRAVVVLQSTMASF